MNAPNPPSPHAVPVGRKPAWANATGWWVLLLCYLILTLPAHLGFSKSGRDFDEASYHYPTVQEIVRTWPQIDMNAPCFSAVAPGYHYLLATIGRFVNDDLRTLRWLNWAFCFLLPLGLYRDFRARLSPGLACLLLLPLVASNFFVKSACWILPDNAGITMMAFVLMGLLRLRDDQAPGWPAGLLAAVATAFRQLNLWLVGPQVLRGAWWFANVNRSAVPPLSVGRRVRTLLPALLCGVVLPLLVVAALYAAWGGLVPAQWRSKNVAWSLSLAGWAYVLSLFGIFGPFYLAGRPLTEHVAAFRRPWMWGVISAALLVSVVTQTAPDVEAGRWGGYLWSAAQRFPVIANRSLLFVLLAPVGAAVIALITRDLGHAQGNVRACTWLISLVAWLCSMSVNRQIFQRYYEPTVLIFLALGASYFPLIGQRSDLPSARRPALAAFALFQGVVTLATVYLL